MDRIGVLIVSKCLSSPAIVDALSNSEEYRPDFYIVEKQPNPYNLERARFHAVVPDLNLAGIVKFASRHRKKIAFGLTDTEDFVAAGGRDLVEKETGVQMICVTRRFAVERSKADQRILFRRIFKEANPSFKVFNPRDYASQQEAAADFKETASKVGMPVIKPDAPARGAGVGVWGKDFNSEKEMTAFFLNALSKGRVVVEEKIEGEESSFHAFSDGKHFVPAPLTRDYKRALDNDEGGLTGGMGSYRGPSDRLPFLRQSDWNRLASAEESAFRRWKGRGSEPGLRGIVLYDAIMHTASGFKVLERNSRGGNTESVNLLATMKDDFAEVCFRILSCSLKGIRFRRDAAVVICAVPLSYGIAASAGDQGQIDLSPAERVDAVRAGRAKVYPMDVRLEEGVCRIGSSRSVAVVGLGRKLEEARELSLAVTKALAGPLRWRSDIGSAEDVGKSRAHLSKLRQGRGRVSV